MSNSELSFIKEMFNTIAPSYDFLNRLLSLRQDVRWRKILAGSIGKEQKDILDVACGTGDVMVEILKKHPFLSSIGGIDFASKMLPYAQRKLTAFTDSSFIHLSAGDAFHLPFKDTSFDALTIAFGIRNIQDRKRALQSFYRVLKPSGTVLILELTVPCAPLIRKSYLFYFNRLLPIIGGLFSNKESAYHYLPQSVMNFPENEVFLKIMGDAGFTDLTYRPLTFGIATLFKGTKA